MRTSPRLVPLIKFFLPESLRKKCFSILYNTVTADYLGTTKTLARIKKNKGFSGITTVMM